MLRDKMCLLVVAMALSVTLVGLAGCGGGSSSTDGTGQLQVSLVDAPLDADEINVDITSVQVHKAGGGWITIKEFASPLRVNLLDYSTGGSALMLADEPLESGHYTMVRLMLSAAEVVKGGQAYPVNLQNVAQTGVKCNGQFTVGDGQLVALVLDFIADRSFINNPVGSNNYMLRPVMSMSPVNVAAEVVGKVEFQDAGVAIPLPENVVVNVYPQGELGNAEALTASATVEQDATVQTQGNFRLAVLAQGTYDFEVVQDTTVVNTITGMTVTAPNTDLGTIVVSVTAP